MGGERNGIEKNPKGTGIATSLLGVPLPPLGAPGSVLTVNPAGTGFEYDVPAAGVTLDTANPQNVGTTAPGTSGKASKSDHVHDLPAVGPGAGAITNPSSITLDAKGRVTAATAGSAPIALTTNLPSTVGTKALGTGTAAAKDDHVHDLPAVGPGAGTTLNPSSITLDVNGRVTALAAGAIDVQLYTANGTWTKPAGARVVLVRCIGSGGGGGSGRRAADYTTGYAGGAGSGGAITELWINAADLAATVAVTVGSGGAGGAAQTTNSTDGNAGSAGTATSFGSSVYAGAGNPGLGGANSANGLGGAAAVGQFSSAAGAPANAIGGSNATPSGYAAGSGGGASGFNIIGAHAGGAGGGVSATNISGGSAGAIGGNGGSGTAGATGMPGSGGGGGGSGVYAGGVGGNGGAGGNYGGGGGGGGVSINGSNSGAGGAGAGGLCYVITF